MNGILYNGEIGLVKRWSKIGCLVGLGLLIGYPTLAKKPVPEDPPPAVELEGMLYFKTFEFAVSPEMVWKYDAATGISRELFEIGGSASHVEPSEFDHDGRWFAATGLVTLDEYPPLPDTTYSRGIYGIFMVSEYDYNYVLINDITFEVFNPGGGRETPPVHWINGDSKILVMARYLDPETWDVVPDSVGLYEIAIDWSSGDPLASGVPVMVEGSDLLPVITTDHYGPQLNIASYDASADGNKIIYSTVQPETDLYSVDLNTGLIRLIEYDLYRARYCDESGEIVAEGVNDWGVFKVSVDGSVTTTLVDPAIRMGGPVWSPAGTEVAYEFYYNPRAAPKRFADIRVISSDDGTELADPSDVNGDLIQVYGWVK